MGARSRRLFDATRFVGDLIALAGPSWRPALLRAAPLLAGPVGRRLGLGPRSLFLLAVGRLLDSPDIARGASAPAPSLLRLLVESAYRSAGRALGRRGRWGLRARRD